MYLNHMVGFSSDASVAISSKYSMYIFAIPRDNGNLFFLLGYTVTKLFAHKMSTPPSGYLLGLLCILLERGQF